MKTEVKFVWAFCMMHWGRSASPVSVGRDRSVALSPHGATTGKCHVGGQAQGATGNGEAHSGIELVQLYIKNHSTYSNRRWPRSLWRKLLNWFKV